VPPVPELFSETILSVFTDCSVSAVFAGENQPFGGEGESGDFPSFLS
jgi:hypothetical protein